MNEDPSKATVEKSCEATAMDYGFFENFKDPVEPCDGIGSVDREGYWLCFGCAEALDALVAIGKACLRARNKEDESEPQGQ